MEDDSQLCWQTVIIIVTCLGIMTRTHKFIIHLLLLQYRNIPLVAASYLSFLCVVFFSGVPKFLSFARWKGLPLPSVSLGFNFCSPCPFVFVFIWARWWWRYLQWAILFMEVLVAHLWSLLLLGNVARICLRLKLRQLQKILYDY